MTSGAEVWSQDFGYDIWGNLYNIAAVNAPGMSLTTPQWNNQIAGYFYDSAGNMTVSPMGGETLTYDAENLPSPRLRQAGQLIDAGGRAVSKQTFVELEDDNPANCEAMPAWPRAPGGIPILDFS